MVQCDWLVLNQSQQNMLQKLLNRSKMHILIDYSSIKTQHIRKNKQRYLRDMVKIWPVMGAGLSEIFVDVDLGRD